MAKNEELLSKFKGCELKSNKEAIRWAVEKYGWAWRTAETYYYQWKKIFMNGANCVPKDVKKNIDADAKTDNATDVEKAIREYKKKKAREESAANPASEVDAMIQEVKAETNKLANKEAEFSKEEKAILDILCPIEENPFKGLEIKFEGNEYSYILKDKAFLVRDTKAGIQFDFASIGAWNTFKNEVDAAFKYAEKLGGLI